jgi:hypothetical protein
MPASRTEGTISPLDLQECIDSQTDGQALARVEFHQRLQDLGVHAFRRLIGTDILAAECLADDANCPEQPEVQGSPEVVADSSSTLLSSPAAAVTIPGQCESEPRAPPDSSEA